MDCISTNRGLDLASDHNGDTDASHHALDDRGDLAAYLPNNRPKQAKVDERSRCPRSVRCPDLGFLCNGFSDFARDVKPLARGRRRLRAAPMLSARAKLSEPAARQILPSCKCVTIVGTKCRFFLASNNKTPFDHWISAGTTHQLLTRAFSHVLAYDEAGRPRLLDCSCMAFQYLRLCGLDAVVWRGFPAIAETFGRLRCDALAHPAPHL